MTSTSTLSAFKGLLASLERHFAHEEVLNDYAVVAGMMKWVGRGSHPLAPTQLYHRTGLHLSRQSGSTLCRNAMLSWASLIFPVMLANPGHWILPDT